MNFGQGAITFTAIQKPAVVPVLSMQNGLSLVGSAGELGGNPLLHDTDFDQVDFDLTILNNGSRKLIMSNLSNNYSFGDIDGSATGIHLEMFPNLNQFNVADNVGANIQIDNLGGLYNFGNLRFGNNKMHMEISDPAKSFQVMADTSLYCVLDGINSVYQMGDLSGVTNGLHMTLLDSTGLVEFNNNAGPLLVMDWNAKQWSMGDVATVNHGTFFFINDSGAGGEFQFFFNGQVIFGITEFTSGGGFYSAPPSGNGAGVWKLGKALAAAVVLDAANYIEVSIDNTVYKLALVN